MDSANVSFVHTAFEAFQRRDVDWLMDNSDPEVEVVMPPEIPDAKRYRGQQGLLDCIADWDAQWQVVKVDRIETAEPASDQVLLGTIQHLEVRDASVQQEVWNLFTLRDGKTLRWELFLSRPPV